MHLSLTTKTDWCHPRGQSPHVRPPPVLSWNSPLLHLGAHHHPPPAAPCRCAHRARELAPAAAHVAAGAQERAGGHAGLPLRGQGRAGGGPGRRGRSRCRARRREHGRRRASLPGCAQLAAGSRAGARGRAGPGGVSVRGGERACTGLPPSLCSHHERGRQPSGVPLRLRPGRRSADPLPVHQVMQGTGALSGLQTLCSFLSQLLPAHHHASSAFFASCIPHFATSLEVEIRSRNSLAGAGACCMIACGPAAATSSAERVSNPSSCALCAAQTLQHSVQNPTSKVRTSDETNTLICSLLHTVYGVPVSICEQWLMNLYALGRAS